MPIPTPEKLFEIDIEKRSIKIKCDTSIDFTDIITKLHYTSI